MPLPTTPVPVASTARRSSPQHAHRVGDGVADVGDQLELAGVDLALDLAAGRRLQPLEHVPAAVAQRAGHGVDEVQLLLDAERERIAGAEAPRVQRIVGHARRYPRKRRQPSTSAGSAVSSSIRWTSGGAASGTPPGATAAGSSASPSPAATSASSPADVEAVVARGGAEAVGAREHRHGGERRADRRRVDPARVGEVLEPQAARRRRADGRAGARRRAAPRARRRRAARSRAAGAGRRAPRRRRRRRRPARRSPRAVATASRSAHPDRRGQRGARAPRGRHDRGGGRGGERGRADDEPAARAARPPG